MVSGDDDVDAEVKQGRFVEKAAEQTGADIAVRRCCWSAIVMVVAELGASGSFHEMMSPGRTMVDAYRPTI